MRRHQRDENLGMPTNRKPRKADSIPVPRKTATQSKEKLQELQATLDLHMSLNKLNDLGIERLRVENDIRALVGDAVNFGATWAQIGCQLRTSGQAAWSRYRSVCATHQPSSSEETSTEWLARMDELPLN